MIFMPPAAELVHLTTFAGFLQSVAVIIPRVILGIVVLFAGLIAGNYVGHEIRSTKITGCGVIADVTKGIIYIFTAIIALEQAGLQISLAKSTFLIVVSGIVFALALAAGLAFGLGMKQDATKAGKSFLKKF